MSSYHVNMQEFADGLQNYLDDEKLNSKYGDKTNGIIRNVQLLSEINARLAKELEFLNAEKISEETFLQRFKDIEIEFEAKLAGQVKRDNA